MFLTVLDSCRGNFIPSMHTPTITVLDHKGPIMCYGLTRVLWWTSGRVEEWGTTRVVMLG